MTILHENHHSKRKTMLRPIDYCEKKRFYFQTAFLEYAFWGTVFGLMKHDIDFQICHFLLSEFSPAETAERNFEGGASDINTALCMLPRKISQQMFRKVVVSTLFWQKGRGYAPPATPAPPSLPRSQSFLIMLVSGIIPFSDVERTYWLGLIVSHFLYSFHCHHSQLVCRLIK